MHRSGFPQKAKCTFVDGRFSLEAGNYLCRAAIFRQSCFGADHILANMPFRFGFMLLSIGIETDLYRDLRRLVPEIVDIPVDIRRFIRSPPIYARIQARFPDERLKQQVKDHWGFMAAVHECNKVLWDEGIVVVACKSGVHRAPTVAEYVQEYAEMPYVVHCNVHAIPAQNAALLVASRIRSKWYGRDIHAAALRSLRPQLRLGWD